MTPTEKARKAYNELLNDRSMVMASGPIVSAFNWTFLITLLPLLRLFIKDARLLTIIDSIIELLKPIFQRDPQRQKTLLFEVDEEIPTSASEPTHP